MCSSSMVCTEDGWNRSCCFYFIYIGANMIGLDVDLNGISCFLVVYRGIDIDLFYFARHIIVGDLFFIGFCYFILKSSRIMG